MPEKYQFITLSVLQQSKIEQLYISFAFETLSFIYITANVQKKKKMYTVVLLNITVCILRIHSPVIAHNVAKYRSQSGQ